MRGKEKVFGSSRKGKKRATISTILQAFTFPMFQSKVSSAGCYIGRHHHRHRLGGQAILYSRDQGAASEHQG